MDGVIMEQKNDDWSKPTSERRDFTAPDKIVERDSSYDPHEEEELDPRVEIELQKMNAAMEGINFLETELMEGKALYNQMLKDAGDRLKRCAEKLGKCVEKARPYFDGLKTAKKAQYLLHQAGLTFEETQRNHHLAKKRVHEAERRAANNCDHLLTQHIQQLLNKATMEFMDTGTLKSEAWKKHQEASVEFTTRQQKVISLSKSLGKQIKKARPYYDMKMALNKQLEPQKERVEKMSEGIQFSKSQYNTTLRNLEQISENIHRMRKIRERQMRQMQKRAMRSSLTASEDESMLTGYQITGSDIEMANSLNNFEMEGMYCAPSVYSMSPTSSSLASLSGTDSEISPEDDTPQDNSVERQQSSSEYEIIDSKDIKIDRPVNDYLIDISDGKSGRSRRGTISIFMPSIRKCRSLTSLWVNNNFAYDEKSREDFDEQRPMLNRQRSLTDGALSLLRDSSIDRTKDDMIADLTMDEFAEQDVLEENKATNNNAVINDVVGIAINVTDCDSSESPITRQIDY